MILPGVASELRTAFDALCTRHGVRPRLLAEVDDMATMRLLARDSVALVLVPSVVVRDELKEGRLHEVCRLADLSESFYAVTVERRFQHPLLRELLDREESELLAVDPDRAARGTVDAATPPARPAGRGRTARKRGPQPPSPSKGPG
jgi:LysR family transcriptional activator of nhaA